MAEVDELRDLEDRATDLERDLHEKRREVLEAGLKDAELSDKERVVHIVKGFAGEQPARKDQVMNLLACFMDEEKAADILDTLARNGEIFEPAEDHVQAV